MVAVAWPQKYTFFSLCKNIAQRKAYFAAAKRKNIIFAIVL